MKATILYYSESGNTKARAEQIKEGMERVEGAEAKTFSIDDIDMDWIKGSDCVILGSPTYYADMPAKVHTFLESFGEYGVAGKLGGAFATAAYCYGGSELVLENTLKFMTFWGMLVFSGGGSLGKPPIHIGPTSVGPDPAMDDTFRLYGERMAKKATELFG